MYPDPTENCGPYSPQKNASSVTGVKSPYVWSPNNHDTIGMIAISQSGHVAAGTSTNGLYFKVPG